MAEQLSRIDPKNLIRESFRIEGIGAAECRSIFLDWAMSLPQDVEPIAAIRLLLDHYAPKAAPGTQPHPMIAVLVAGAQASAVTPRRRGGRAARMDP
ncbi:hypothetical protein [Paracoccus salsus]|uniref:hypothetical protein n=1 Tax=Paracoccus salsus TaxID=2911061 RepID=UPI001F233E52|nr:hypothetical protein [Paracoccus salsus]MCF3973159.1 hypothetical protein [Paracoccus salsus]